MLVYQLLAERFCHDISSPINALGLTLEMLSSDKSAYHLAQLSYLSTVNLLGLYRVLFACKPQSDAVEKSTSIIRNICTQKDVRCSINIKRFSEEIPSPVHDIIEEQSDNNQVEGAKNLAHLSRANVYDFETDIGKALVCILYLCLPYTAPGDSVEIKQSSTFCYEMTCHTSKNPRVRESLAAAPEEKDLSQKSSNDVVPVLLKLLLSKWQLSVDINGSQSSTNSETGNSTKTVTIVKLNRMQPW
ncbi:MAG: hypothetical protein LBQ43_01895 [Holosporales bacterium]|jgi:hypothetical protein|nr:hypothetical protein [Holosporales bacterium]